MKMPACDKLPLPPSNPNDDAPVSREQTRRMATLTALHSSERRKDNQPRDDDLIVIIVSHCRWFAGTGRRTTGKQLQ
jgi:hypothetical protein